MSRMLIKLIGPIGPSNRCLMCRSMATHAATSNSNNNNNKATLAQLSSLEQRLSFTLPNLFKSSHDLSMYSRDIQLIDNIRNIKTQGLSQYALQVGLVKIYYALRYTSSSLELLNLVKNPEESFIKIRWRIVAKAGFIRFALFFWKYKSLDTWKDGISTFHVNDQGKIYCHVCDNIDVDTDDINKRKNSIKNPLINQGLNVNIKRSIVI